MKNLTAICIMFGVVMSACKKDEEYKLTNFSTDDIIQEIVLTPDTLVANGIDSLFIQTIFPDDSDDSLVVSFETSLGTFTNGTKTSSVFSKTTLVNDAVKIIAGESLTAGTKVGTAKINILVAGYERTLDIRLVRNLSTDISIIPNSLTMSSTLADELEINVKLSSTNGKVSVGQNIETTVWDELYENEIGVFRLANNSSDEAENCKYLFSMANDTSYEGTANIVSKTSSPTATIADTVTIYITD